MLQTADKTVDTLTSPVAEHAGFARQRTEAAVSQAQADVDEISAKLEVAKTKHSMALSALNALKSVTDD